MKTFAYMKNNLELYDFDESDPLNSEVEELFISKTEFNRFSIKRLVTILELTAIKHIEFDTCNFINDRLWDLSQCHSLRKIHMRDCAGQLNFALTCLTSPRLIELKINTADDMKLVQSNKSTLPNYLMGIAGMIEGNYSLANFDCNNIQIYLASNAGLRNLSATRNMVMESHRRITNYVKRNVAGRQRCRDVIYTLFLIKYYSLNNVFRLMDKHVLMVIARHLYASIGTKCWCE